MSVLLGRKIAMTQSFSEEGTLLPVTVIQAGPCRVLGLRTKEQNGYEAAILGFEQIEGSKLKSKPGLGFFKKLGSPVFKVIREFRGMQAEINQEVSVEAFKAGDLLQIQGMSRGKGWAGAIKRWNFSRGRETHGGKFNRALGSTGNNTWPARTFRGRRMSGRLGYEKVSIKNVEVLSVIPEDNLLIVKGPVPGGENGLLTIKKIVERKAGVATN